MLAKLQHLAVNLVDTLKPKRDERGATAADHGMSAKSPRPRPARPDAEPFILVPILSFLLTSAVATLWEQASSGKLADGAGALTIIHQLLRLTFYVLMISLLLVRKPSKSTAPARRAAVAAYVGTFTPFLLVLEGMRDKAGQTLTVVAVLVTTLGLGLSVYALGWLGRSFGVVPQARELVRSGPYRYVRHPLYVAEFITFVGAILTVVTPFSAAVLVLFVAAQTYRAIQEEKVLKVAFPEYESYMSQAGRFTPRWQVLSGAS